MIDKICFGMPRDPERAIMAATVVQDYRMQILRQIQMKTHGPDFELWVAWPDERMKWARPLLWDAGFLDEYHPVRGEWEYAYDFEEGWEAAYELSLPTGKSAVGTLGALLGADPPKDVPTLRGQPDLERLTSRSNEVAGAVLVLACEEQKTIVRLIENHFPEAKILAQSEPTDLEKFDVWEWVDNVAPAQLVIGRRGWETALLSAAGKWLLELYPDDVHSQWFAKWGTGRYQQIYGREFPLELIWAGLEVVWDRWTRFCLLESTAPSIQMGQ